MNSYIIDLHFFTLITLNNTEQRKAALRNMMNDRERKREVAASVGTSCGQRHCLQNMIVELEHAQVTMYWRDA